MSFTEGQAFIGFECLVCLRIPPEDIAQRDYQEAIAQCVSNMIGINEILTAVALGFHFFSIQPLPLAYW